MAKKSKEVLFTKEQILESDIYANRRDALGVILKDKQGYTLKDVDILLDKFMKGKVD